MARAAIYARFSSHSQRDESIEDQVRVCRAAIDRDGHSIAAVFADSAISGRTDERPDFQRMVAAAERGAFDLLYVYKGDRFARNRYDSAVYKSRLRKAGVTVVSATENIPDGAEGILMESVLEGMAEYYSANLAQNIRRGIEGNALACRANGRRVFGYRTGADGRYEVDEAEAEVVLRVFRDYAAGSTMRQIIASLGGARTRLGKPFTPAYVSKVLHNEAYRGVYDYAGHRVEGGMPAIVDNPLWAEVQGRLKGNGRHRRCAVNYILSGKLYSEDGEPFVGSSSTGASGNTYRYYRLQRPGGDVHVRQDEIEESVAGGVMARLSEKGSIEYVADLIVAALDDANATDTAEMARLESELARNDREYDRVIDAVCKVGADDRMAGRIESLRSERERIQEALSRMRSGIPRLTREAVLYWLQDMAAWSDARELVANFVSRVTLTNEGRVFVEFNMLNNPKIRSELPSSAEISQLDGSSHLFTMVEARRIELRSTAIP